MGGENTISRFLTSDTISEVSQNDFDTEKLSVTPKHGNLPRNEDKNKGTPRLALIVNPFKVINISTDTYTQEI